MRRYVDELIVIHYNRWQINSADGATGPANFYLHNEYNMEQICILE